MLESQLVNQSHHQIATFLDSGDRLISTREFPLQRRYVDILFAVVSDNFSDDLRILSPLKYLKSFQLSYLAFFSDGKRKTSVQIENFFQKSIKDIHNNHLSTFENRSLIKRIGKKTYVASDWVDYLPSKIISVEAKLKDIKNVISQAEFNSRFSSESYILVPSNLEHTVAKHQDYLKSRNLGVIYSKKNFELKLNESSIPKKSTSLFNYRTTQLHICKNYLSNKSNWQVHN